MSADILLAGEGQNAMGDGRKRGQKAQGPRGLRACGGGIHKSVTRNHIGRNGVLL
jgi:hypothetical protein